MQSASNAQPNMIPHVRAATLYTYDKSWAYLRNRALASNDILKTTVPYFAIHATSPAWHAVSYQQTAQAVIQQPTIDGLVARRVFVNPTIMK